MPIRIFPLFALILAAAPVALPAADNDVMHSGKIYDDEVLAGMLQGTPRSSGSIFQDSGQGTLYSDQRATAVGDMITIILSERTNASKSASTSTSKDSAVDMPSATLLGSPFSASLPSVLPGGGRALTLENTAEATRSFDGSGDSTQSNTLSGSITAVVTDRLPNGYLRVKGEKRISINQGDEYVRIEGYVRPADIRSNNTILSMYVANAEISYGGSGILNEANQIGWLARFFNSKWWPF